MTVASNPCNWGHLFSVEQRVCGQFVACRTIALFTADSRMNTVVYCAAQSYFSQRWCCLRAGLAEASATLLALAEECGLSHLQAVVLDYIVMHYDAVRRCQSHTWCS